MMPLVYGVNDMNANQERWIRLPTTGRCPDCGLTRPHFYELIGKGVIKTACLKKPGNLKGVRLVWLPSVLAYIEKHVEKVEVS